MTSLLRKVSLLVTRTAVTQAICRKGIARECVMSLHTLVGARDGKDASGHLRLQGFCGLFHNFRHLLDLRFPAIERHVHEVAFLRYPLCVLLCHMPPFCLKQQRWKEKKLLDVPRFVESACLRR